MYEHRISIAPMMAWTDRHYRYLLRLITQRALLYTEMIHTGALLHGDPERFLAYDPLEHPVAVQLGGSCPQALAKASQLVQQAGFDEVNLNLGCPSDKVQAGQFGACLMAKPQLVADCVQAMREAVTIPVTVKTRIGIDQQDSYAELAAFIEKLAQAGCQVFIVHARKAWLQGLSPKQNREVPPLRYEYVYQLKRDFPALSIIINGGLTTVQQYHAQLSHVDGVMIGRQAYQDPYSLITVDSEYYGSTTAVPSRIEVIENYLAYVAQQCQQQIPLRHMSKHLLSFFQGQIGAKRWRRYLSEHMHVPGADQHVIRGALACMQQATN
jgi:tRNA-dihydrouridine synthase A